MDEAAAAAAAAAAERNSRKRKRKIAPRVLLAQVDESARLEARQRRLDALESDDVVAAGENDDEYEPDHASEDDYSDDAVVGAIVGKSKKKSKANSKPSKAASVSTTQKKQPSRQKQPVRRAIEAFNVPLDLVLAEEAKRAAVEGTTECTYEHARALPSRFPARRICSVCGFQAPYTCVRCGSRFCTVQCGVTHDETRCLKFTQ
ncbi:Zinc finger HIT domain-containing protein 1 [Porphyridium purpureum]|uniref:Zinc finger HIT domain-containing protein 1 n=1 Tax=Porphyridium purpureum TaxID=35688 RepID=A0A5J4YUW7_PORPP|nr:Zinc finger HIT domain-containing protein 1 [Porphyridium purpureum]|eukprot:POR8537..scf227_4